MKDYNFIITLLFISLYALFNKVVILYVFFAILFLLEIYYFAKNKYTIAFEQAILLIPLLGVIAVNKIPLLNIYIALIIVYCFICYKKVKININKNVFLFYILFVILDFIKFLIFNGTLSRTIDLIELPVLYISIFAGLLLYNICIKDMKMEKFLFSFVKGTIISVIYGIIKRFLSGGFIFAFVNNSILTRNSGASGDPNYFGLYICISVAIILLKFYKKLNLKYILGVLALLFVGLTSSSRMYYGIMIFELTIIFFIIIKNFRVKSIFSIIFGLFVVFVLFFLFKDYIFSNFNYLLSRLKDRDITNGRAGLITTYTNIINSNIVSMLFGIGIHQYNIRSGCGAYAHNLYMEFYVTQGILGIIILLFTIFSLSVKFSKKMKINKLINLLPLVIFLIGGFGVNYIEVESFYILFSLMIACINYQNDDIDKEGGKDIYSIS